MEGRLEMERVPHHLSGREYEAQASANQRRSTLETGCRPTGDWPLSRLPPGGAGVSPAKLDRKLQGTGR